MKKTIRILTGLAVAAVAVFYFAFNFFAQKPTEWSDWSDVHSRVLDGEEIVLDDLVEEFGKPRGFGYGESGRDLIMVEYRMKKNAENPNTGVYVDLREGRVVGLGFGTPGQLEDL